MINRSKSELELRVLIYFVFIDNPESKSQVQAQSQIEKGKRHLDSGLPLKSYRSHTPPTPPTHNF